MWNDTDVPLAYLITFRCYGTWLHGDERGSIDRFHNQYNSPYLSPHENLRKDMQQNLRGEIVTLNITQREAVESALREVCEVRNWLLHASNVRTNHIHLVVNIGAAKPERALNDFKSYATRKMRQNRYWLKSLSPWSDKGSTRYLWNAQSLDRAVDYVINGQGDVLPEFD